MNFTITEGNLDAAVAVNLKIPEFTIPYTKETFENRLKDKDDVLILVAYDGNMPIGFKVGYALNENTYYTWMGGVLPGYRRQGVAKALAVKQEEFIREKGYGIVRLKTWNKHTNMLIFAISKGFKIVDIEKKDNIDDTRIILEKSL